MTEEGPIPDPAPGAVAGAACLTPYLEAWEGLEREGDGSVLGALRAAAESHRRLVADIELDTDRPPEWEVRSERLLDYRRRVDDELLSPLSLAYEHNGPTASVEGALRAARERCVQLTLALPEKIEAPWPDDALARKPSDSLGRRLGKSLARVFSEARKTGRERSLPLRSVTVRNLDEMITRGQDEVGSLAFAAWATWSRRLEALWVEWGQAALPALVRSEQIEEEPEEAQELWETIREAAATLQAGLDALVADAPATELAEAARARLGAARGRLEADLAVAGSFLLDPPPAARPSATLTRISRVGPGLVAWDEGVAARMWLYLSLLSILSGATAVQRRMVWRFRDRCLTGVGELSGIADALEALVADVAGVAESASLEKHFDTLDTTVKSVLEPATRAIPETGVVDTAVREISDSTIEALSAMIRQAPGTLVLHSTTSKAPAGGRTAETRALPLQELARQSFDALRVERIRSSTSGLVEALDAARGNVSELAVVYTFARDEATRELEAGEEGARARAIDLVEGALRSTAEALRTQVTNLDTAVEAAQHRLASEISDGSSALLDRVGAGRMEARLFAARSRVAQLRAWLNERWGPPVERAARRLRTRVAHLRRLGSRVMRRGSAIVGSGPAETAASDRVLRALADPRAATEGQPLVYQRLFTLEPVFDPALLAGRERGLTDAMRRWRRWHDDDGIPLIVRGRQGSGITSFLNVLEAEIAADGGVVEHSTLKDRITTEADLAVHLAGPLGLEPVDSLEALATVIFDAAPRALPAAVALDNLEHLYLRVPQGTDLIERLLTLMAETEPRVFWIGGITASAWQLVATAEPTAVSQVDILDLPPLEAPEIRAAIMVRHRRSGLRIRYEEPTTGRHLLRRRLKRMRDAEGYRQLLEEDYFDRLHKASGGHVGLALHQWLMAADFTSGDGVLMRQPQRPDFAILAALDLTQNFTLKALLEHRSLTLGEHDRIFRMPRQESYQIFESLRNRHLLEPLVRGEEDSEARSEIQEDLRYRVRPLLTGAVIAHLQERNIVH